MTYTRRVPEVAERAIVRVARSKRAKAGVRAWFGRAPGADEVAARFERLVRRMFRGHVVAERGDVRGATLSLHPRGKRVRLAIRDDGDISVTIGCGSLGPGFALDALARLNPLWDELEYTWAEPIDADGIRAAHVAWLAGELRRIAPARAQIGVPDERSFVVDQPVLSALGPRDHAWRDAVMAEPPDAARAADVFPWWQGGPGTRERAEALIAMWQAIAWRPPLDRAEYEALAELHRLLAAAHAADPALALPWPAWRDVIGLLADAADHLDELADDGGDEPIAPIAIAAPLAAEVRRRAGDEPNAIGYRRYDLEVELSGGWSVRMPGSFLGAWTDDDSRYVATDGERALELTTLTASGGISSEELLAVAPTRFPVVETLDRGGHTGRAEVTTDADGTTIVHGIVTAAPDVAILTCRGDRAWGLATWRTLRRF